MEQPIHKISLLLGKVEAQIHALREEAQEMRTSYTKIYDKLEKISQQLYATEQHMRSFEERLVNVEKPVTRLRSWQERGAGALLLLCILLSFMGEAVKDIVLRIFPALL